MNAAELGTTLGKTAKQAAQAGIASPGMEQISAPPMAPTNAMRGMARRAGISSALPAAIASAKQKNVSGVPGVGRMQSRLGM